MSEVGPDPAAAQAEILDESAEALARHVKISKLEAYERILRSSAGLRMRAEIAEVQKPIEMQSSDTCKEDGLSAERLRATQVAVGLVDQGTGTELREDRSCLVEGRSGLVGLAHRHEATPRAEKCVTLLGDAPVVSPSPCCFGVEIKGLLDESLGFGDEGMSRHSGVAITSPEWEGVMASVSIDVAADFGRSLSVLGHTPPWSTLERYAHFYEVRIRHGSWSLGPKSSTHPEAFPHRQTYRCHNTHQHRYQP